MTSDRLKKLLKLLEKDPDDPFMHYAVGLEYISMKRYREGIAELQDLLQRDSRYVPAYHQLGLLFAQLRKKDEAISILQQGIRVAADVGDQHERVEMEEILGDLRKPFKPNLG